MDLAGHIVLEMGKAFGAPRSARVAFRLYHPVLRGQAEADHCPITSLISRRGDQP